MQHVPADVPACSLVTSNPVAVVGGICMCPKSHSFKTVFWSFKSCNDMAGLHWAIGLCSYPCSTICSAKLEVGSTGYLNHNPQLDCRAISPSEHQAAQLYSGTVLHMFCPGKALSGCNCRCQHFNTVQLTSLTQWHLTLHCLVTARGAAKADAGYTTSNNLPI